MSLNNSNPILACIPSPLRNSQHLPTYFTMMLRSCRGAPPAPTAGGGTGAADGRVG